MVKETGRAINYIHKIVPVIPGIPSYPAYQSIPARKRFSFGVNESYEETSRVAVERSNVIGSCTLCIKRPLQRTMLNVSGASCDLCDVSLDFNTRDLPWKTYKNTVSRGKRAIYHGKLSHVIASIVRKWTVAWKQQFNEKLSRRPVNELSFLPASL